VDQIEKMWDLRFLRINFGQSIKEEIDIPNPSLSRSKGFNFCIETFGRGISAPVVKEV